MKSLVKYFRSALICSLVLGALCCVVYPAALTLAGQALFPEQAGGSLITVRVNGEEQAVGSRYVGQQFEDDRFFHGRVSSVNYNCYTEEEKAEQAALRQEYLAAIRASLRGTLNNISIQEQDGTITDLGKKHGNIPL